MRRLWRNKTAGCVLAALLLFAGDSEARAGQPSVNASTIVGKTLVGYQGWFRCPGDGSPENSWSHWSKGKPSASTMAVDVYPDVSGLDAASRCTLPDMPTAHGPGEVFSSFPPQTAETHFAWMQQYGIDGALVQRFVADIPKDYREHDAVLTNVRAAAERHGRVFAVEYDLSGALTPEQIELLKKDWTYLTHELQIDRSRAYLHESGKPLVSIWGVGFADVQHSHDPEAMLSLIRWFENEGHAAVMAGVPAGWGTLDGDSQSDPRWREVYAAARVIQPWTVGRYRSVAGVAQWEKTHLAPDLALAKRNGQIYMPVIFPGFSWHNLNPTSAENEIPRLGGDFLWQQALAAKAAGAATVKIAMFDEVNEGTAIFKAVSKREQASTDGYWLTLDADGKNLPPDFYLLLAGKIERLFAKR